MNNSPPVPISIVPETECGRSDRFESHSNNTAVAANACFSHTQGADSRLSATVVTDFAAAGLDAAAWDRAVEELEGTVYMTYDWVRLWWQFYGRKRQLRIFIFRSGSRIVGLVPIFLDSFGVPTFRLRLARLVGAGIPPKVFDPPVAREWAAEIWPEIIKRLFGQDQCDLLSFGPVSNDYQCVEALRDSCQHQPALVAGCETLPRDVRTIYHLPATYEEYFASLDAKERKVRRKKLRELEGVGPLRAEVVHDTDAVAKEFENFAGQHTRQWQADGRPGHFHAWPNALDYNRALVKTLGRLGRVRFYKLVSGEHVVTNQYTYAFGKKLYAELPARISGSEWDSFSLGCTSQIKLIEAVIQDGFRRMDSGLGHYEYKLLTGGTESPVNTIYVIRKGALSRVKVFCFRKLNDLLRLLLHKVWYRNIMPRLPSGFRSGQSRLLLRMDF